MSHWMKIDGVQITNLDILKKACENLGLELDENKKTHRSGYAGEIKCEAVVKDKKGGEAALVHNTKSQDMSIQWDAYGNSLAQAIGREAELLTREYATEVVKAQVSQVGMLTDQQVQADGSVVLQGVFV